MSIVRTVEGGGQIFFCPGCKSTHSVNTARNGPRWTYNGDPARPTFSPSILVTTRWSETDATERDDVCHSFVRDGKIQFLGDCTHELAGKTVSLPEWPYAPNAYGGIVDAP
jgi:hypothetical protein